MALITSLTDRVRAKVETEKKKTSLVDDYGTWAWWMGVASNRMLALIGGLFDAIVLASIFYLSTRNWAVSLILAIVLSSAIQIGMGISLTKAVKTAARKDYDKGPGFKYMMLFAGIIVAVMLGLTLYLSYNSGAVVEAFTEDTLKLTDEVQAASDQDEQIKELTAQYKEDLSALESSAAKLEEDRVMWEGKWTVRERSSRQAAKIRGQEIPALQAAYQKNLQSLSGQRATIFERIAQSNDAKIDRHEMYVEKTSSTVVWFNIIFNLIRCVIIAAFTLFLVYAGNEIQQPKPKPAASPAASFSPSVATVLAARPPVNNEVEPERKQVRPFQQPPKPEGPKMSARDLRNLKEAARMNFKTAIDVSKPPETRASNRALYMKRIDELRKAGMYCRVDEKNRIFEVYNSKPESV